MSKDNFDIGKITADLQEKYPEVGIKSIEVNPSKGTSTFYIAPTPKSLAFLGANEGAVTPRVSNQEKASTINRDYITRTALDLASKPGALNKDPHELFKMAYDYYYADPVVGPATNLVASFAMKGFENDIDDEKIKNFYDVWAFNVNLEEVLEWISLELLRSGHVTTYKVIGPYKPKVSYLPNKGPGKKGFKKEVAARKKIWSKNHIPTAYTVLNPAFVNVSGNLLFNKVSTTVKFPQALTKLLNKPLTELSDDEKELIKSLPTELKKAAKEGKEYQLDSRLVGQITYRKQPYERYGKPRITRIFDSLEYKKALKNADLSTLDGISNYILQITIGNDEYPVTSQTELEAVAKLFNTPSKSFDVVWNHTLDIKKIVSPEIDKILGKGKYEQVVDDITTGLAISRAFLDGGGELTGPEAELLVKGLKEEIDYVRRQIERWIYREYQQVAEIMGFDRFPKIRWDEGILLDTILFMNTLAQLVDRRMLSYRTALESLGFDYPNELKNMKEEMPLVEKGTFGILGSPWQKPNTTSTKTTTVPAGTPSSGPPKGTVRQTKIDPKKVTKKSDTSPNQQKRNLKTKQAASFDLESLATLAPSEYAAFLDGARLQLDDQDYVTFVEEMTKYRLLG